MHIVIMSYENSTIPPVIIQDVLQNDFSNGSPRIQKTELIDGTIYPGGSYFHTTGDFQADREFNIQGTVTLTQAEYLRRLKEGPTKCKLATYTELFSGYIQNLNVTNGNLTLTFWPDARLCSLSDLSSPPAPAPSTDPWGDYTDNTYWTPSRFTWTGSAWNTTTYDDTTFLSPLGGWEVGFRPTKIRFEYTNTGNAADGFTLNTPAGNMLLQVGDIVSGFEYDLTDKGADISALSLIFSGSAPNATISKIEFYDAS